MDWEVSLQLSSTGPSNILPQKWYFMEIGDNASTNATYLYGNVPINNLNEWSLDKLGWYKTSRQRSLSRQVRKMVDSSFHQTRDDQVVAHTFSQIKRSLNVNVRNCAGNAHSYMVKILLFLNLSYYISLVIKTFAINSYLVFI